MRILDKGIGQKGRKKERHEKEEPPMADGDAHQTQIQHASVKESRRHVPTSLVCEKRKKERKKRGDKGQSMLRQGRISGRGGCSQSGGAGYHYTSLLLSNKRREKLVQGEREGGRERDERVGEEKGGTSRWWI
jgi:hypothetical protein